MFKTTNSSLFKHASSLQPCKFTNKLLSKHNIENFLLLMKLLIHSQKSLSSKKCMRLGLQVKHFSKLFAYRTSYVGYQIWSLTYNIDILQSILPNIEHLSQSMSSLTTLYSFIFSTMSLLSLCLPHEDVPYKNT